MRPRGRRERCVGHACLHRPSRPARDAGAAATISNVDCSRSSAAAPAGVGSGWRRCTAPGARTAIALLAASACGLVAIAPADGALARARRAQTRGALDRGIYVHYCPRARRHRARRSSAGARVASTSHAGWPPDECLKMDKEGPGRHHVLVGQNGVHNYLLGGYGNDTIIGGDRGDVIWGDYHPNNQPAHQTAIIHAGNGKNFIYANDTRNYVWTGTNPHTVVHAHGSGISGIIHCQSPGIVVYLSTVSERHVKLDGCHHISHFSVGY
jgi:hypothetical protein